jgi:hypothetical protein
MKYAIDKINENPSLNLSINLEYYNLIDEEFIKYLEDL